MRGASRKPRLGGFPVRWERWFDDFESHYVLVAEFPPGTHAHYGSFGARIWKRR